MATLQRKNVSSPDETRTFPHGSFNIVRLGDFAIANSQFEPGWRWSEHVKPIAGTESCQTHHMGHLVSGRLGVRMNDGTEMEFGPGDVYEIPPGHDGWVIGDEPAVGFEIDRKSTRLNSSHANISYAVFCLKKKKNMKHTSDAIAGVTNLKIQFIERIFRTL